MIVLFALKIKNKYEIIHAYYESLRCQVTLLEMPSMGV